MKSTQSRCTGLEARAPCTAVLPTPHPSGPHLRIRSRRFRSLWFRSVWFRSLWFRLSSLVFLTFLTLSSLNAAIIVRTDQAVYTVTPGQTFFIDVHIDFDDQTLGSVFEPLPSGLFSYGMTLSYPLGMATIPTTANIQPVSALDFFGFTPGAMEQVTVNSAMIKGNIDQTLNIPYTGSLLARFQITNLAPASSSYLAVLDEWRTLGPLEQIFLDGTGIVLDTVPSTNLFLPARINVIPEPAGPEFSFVASIVLAFLYRSRLPLTGRRPRF